MSDWYSRYEINFPTSTWEELKVAFGKCQMKESTKRCMQSTWDEKKMWKLTTND